MAATMVGLEITEEEVRAAEISVGKKPKILKHGTVRLPAGAAKDSEVLDRAAVVEALRELWKKTGFKSKQVVLGICSRRVLVRDYHTQAMGQELLRQALPFQVADLLPVPADQAVIDFYPVEQNGDQLSGLLVAAVADTVQELVDTVTQAKLRVEQVDLSPFGLLRAIGMLTDSTETVAVVHLGPHTSYVVVAVQGVPRFVRIMPLELAGAGLDYDDEVDEEVQDPSAPLPSFEQGGDEGPLRRRRRRADALAPEKIEDIVTQIVNTLRFHVERTEGRTIDRVMLTGVGAGIPGVLPGFAARMTVPVQVVGGHLLSPPEATGRHGQDDLELLTPVGLAMTGGR